MVCAVVTDVEVTSASTIRLFFFGNFFFWGDITANWFKSFAEKVKYRAFADSDPGRLGGAAGRAALFISQEGTHGGQNGIFPTRGAWRAPGGARFLGGRSPKPGRPAAACARYCFLASFYKGSQLAKPIIISKEEEQEPRTERGYSSKISAPCAQPPTAAEEGGGPWASN